MDMTSYFCIFQSRASARADTQMTHRKESNTESGHNNSKQNVTNVSVDDSKLITVVFLVVGIKKEDICFQKTQI